MASAPGCNGLSSSLSFSSLSSSVDGVGAGGISSALVLLLLLLLLLLLGAMAVLDMLPPLRRGLRELLPELATDTAPGSTGFKRRGFLEVSADRFELLVIAVSQDEDDDDDDAAAGATGFSSR